MNFQRTELSYEQRSEIAGAFKCGVDQVTIATKLGISKSTVNDTVKRIKETGTPHPCKRPGASPLLSERGKRSLTRIIRSNRNMPLDVISEKLGEEIGQYISIITTRKYLREQEFQSYYVTKKPLLTPENAAIRLHWCKEHKNWILPDWKQVTFSDESRFALYNPDGGERLWRKPSEKYQKDCVAPTVQMGGGSVMFWGVFSYWGVGPLVRVSNAMNSDEYIEVLANNYLPWINELTKKRTLHDPPVIYQQDNCSIHKSNYVKWWMGSHDFDVLDWPSRSPDINPIENLWDIVDSRVRKRVEAPKSLELLASAVIEEWNNIPLEILHHLYESMPRRINSCIGSKGYHTKY